MRKYLLFLFVISSLISCNQDDDFGVQRESKSSLYYKGGEEIDSTFVPPPLYAEEGDPPPKSGSGNGGKPSPNDSIKIN